MQIKMQNCDIKVNQTYFQNNFQTHFLNQNHKYRITKKLSLLLHTQSKPPRIIFHGTIYHLNGLQLKLSSKYSQILSQYHTIQTKSLQFIYNFERQSINVLEKLEFKMMKKLSKQRIQTLVQSKHQQILGYVKSFVEKLSLYGMTELKGRLSFQQFHRQNLFLNNIITKFTSSRNKNSCLHTKRPSIYSTIQDQNQLEEQEPKLQNSESNVLISSIQLFKQIPKLLDLPDKLQSGPKNIRYQFASGVEIYKPTGGFYEIQKVLCSFIKQPSGMAKSNLKQIYYNPLEQNLQSQANQSNCKYQTDVLVRKVLKKDRYQVRANRVKITKELAVVEQVKNKTHLINYYLNSNDVNSKDIFFNLFSKEIRGSRSLFQQFAKIQSQQKIFPLQIPQIYMDCHPHTLDDYIHQPHNSIDSLISISVQFLSAVTYLHKSKVIHRDLKPQNVLIDFSSSNFNPTLKLIDFSQSSIFKSYNQRFYDQNIPLNCIQEIFQKHNPKLFAATMPFSPPQCQFQRQNFMSSGVNSFKIDSWSMGMILPEILTGKRLVNFSKPYADEVMRVLKDVGFEVYHSKKKRRGFGMIESLGTLIGMCNIIYDQEERMDVQECLDLFVDVEKKVKQWTAMLSGKQEKRRDNLTQC